jgi:hypothetical protein
MFALLLIGDSKKKYEIFDVDLKMLTKNIFGIMFQLPYPE